MSKHKFPKKQKKKFDSMSTTIMTIESSKKRKKKKRKLVFKPINLRIIAKKGIKNTTYMIQYGFIENNHVSGMVEHRYHLNKL